MASFGPAGQRAFFCPCCSWPNVNITHRMLRRVPFAMVQMNRMAGKTEKWPHRGKCPLPSTGPKASLGTMWPRSEKYPCLRIKSDSAWIVLDPDKMSGSTLTMQKRNIAYVQTVSPILSFRVYANPSSTRQPSGLQLADVWARTATEGA